MPRRGGMSSFLSSFGSVGVRFFGRSAGTGWRCAVEVVRASRVVDAAGSPGFVGACDAVGFRGPGLGAAEGAVPVCGVVPVCGAVEVCGAAPVCGATAAWAAPASPLRGSWVVRYRSSTGRQVRSTESGSCRNLSNISSTSHSLAPNSADRPAAPGPVSWLDTALPPLLGRARHTVNPTAWLGPPPRLTHNSLDPIEHLDEALGKDFALSFGVWRLRSVSAVTVSPPCRSASRGWQVLSVKGVAGAGYRGGSR